MPDIKFYGDRWKDSTAILIFSIHPFSVSFFKIMNEKYRIQVSNNIQGCMVQNLLKIDQADRI